MTVQEYAQERTLELFICFVKCVDDFKISCTFVTTESFNTRSKVFSRFALIELRKILLKWVSVREKRGYYIKAICVFNYLLLQCALLVM
jgi:hypothetical protein